MSDQDVLVQWATDQLGKPYDTYRDCSGFTAAAYRQIGITIPEGSVAQYGVGKERPARFFQPGDLLFWDTFGEAPGHVALYAGNGKVIHALNEQRGIVESSWDANMGGPYMGARRILVSEDSPIVDEPNPMEDISKVKHQRRKNRRKRLEQRP